MRLLVVEDEPLLAQALHESLQRSNFSVIMSNSTTTAWRHLLDAPIDLILLDIMLPEGDDAGFRFATEVREAGFHQPILFLSARETLPDIVRGLQHGDDYLAKPFALPELTARLKALYRRGDVRPKYIKWQTIELFGESRVVRKDQELVRLTAKEYEVLELLMFNPGRIFARDEIIERVWGYGFETPSNLIEVYIKNLRLKLMSQLIETVRGLGYRFPGN